MTKTTEIQTRFSLTGLREAQAGFRRFGDQTRSTLGGIRTAGANALQPMQKDIARARRSLRALSMAATQVSKVGFATMRIGADRAFKVMKTGALAVTASIIAISAAAVKASKDTAAELDKISKDSRRLGISTEDLSVLNFAAAREGVNPDDVVKGIARIGSEFVDVRNKIKEADDEFLRFVKRNHEDAKIAIASGDTAEMERILSENRDAENSSLAAIRHRMKNASSSREKEDLQQAEKDLIDSFGPSAEALFGLEKYGLDVEKTAKGGVEGLVALSDAMRRVEDPSERLRYSILLFGRNAGPKMLTLLESGREGIDGYRKELERLGGVVSKADAELGAAYEDSAENMRRSFSGIKLAVSRELLPSMTQFNEYLTEFFVQNRDIIAQTLGQIGRDAKVLGRDLLNVFSGDRSNIQTDWLEDYLVYFDQISEIAGKLKEDIRSIADGGKAQNFEWVNVLHESLVTVASILEKLQPAFLDFLRILNGGDAIDFTWMNDARDNIVSFSKAFKEAFDMFTGTIKGIKDAIYNLTGLDITSTVLFLGIARFTGALGLALTSAKKLGQALKWIFGGKMGASVLSGIGSLVGAGGAGAGVGTAATGAAAGAGLWQGVKAGAGRVLGGIGDAARAGVNGVRGAFSTAGGSGLARTVAARAFLPIAAVEGGYQIGAYGGRKLYERSDHARQQEAERDLYRRQNNASFDEAFRSWSRERQQNYFNSRPSNDQRFMPNLSANHSQNQGVVSDRVALDLTINGTKASFEGDPLAAREMMRSARQSMRNGR